MESIGKRRGRWERREEMMGWERSEENIRRVIRRVGRKEEQKIDGRGEGRRGLEGREDGNRTEEDQKKRKV